MTKMPSRQSMKELIVNQDTSTVDDLYAKRNAVGFEKTSGDRARAASLRG